MTETIISMELPAGGHLAIRRNRIRPEGEERNLSRISLVSGIHGDELEGQYICYETARRVKEHPEYLKGIVDIYPALNPLGIDMASRTVPRLDMDMNRMFPGDASGDMMERITATVVDSLIGSDICIDLHASDIFVREIPQVRLSEDFAEALLPYAKMTNADMIWMNATATVHESTLAHSMNLLGVPTLVLEMGQGHDIHRSFGNQIVDGIFHIMSEMGIWTGPEPKVQEPAISSDGEVEFIRSKSDGVFLPLIEHNHYVKKGDLIVANKNFGCGSSREHAPLCLKTAGVSCIIAETFARIFYRNAINIGLPIIECPEAAKEIKAGDEVEVDFDSGKIYDRTKGTEYQGQAFPEFMQKLIAAGGLVNYTNHKKNK